MLQSVPLAPDVQYFLDGALDAFDMNAFAHAALTLYGDRRTIIEIVDRTLPAGQRYVPCRVAKCLELDRYAHEVTTDLPEADRRALFASALVMEPARIDALADVHAGWAVEDAVLGGCLKPYRRRPRILPGDRIPPRLVNRLLSARYAAHYVRISDDSSLPHYKTLAGRLRLLPWPESIEEAHGLDAHYAEARTRYAEANRRGLEDFLIREGDRFRAIGGRARLVNKDRTAKAQRKVAARAAQAAMTVLPEAEVGRFLRGEPITIPAASFAFRVTKVGGHNGITVRVASNTGADLAGLCVYFEDTPASDQLAALALHAAAGEEGALLARGNLYQVTPEGARHPLIADRARRESEARAAALPWHRRGNSVREACQALAERAKPLYQAEITAQVWGADAPRLIAFTEEIAALPVGLAA